MNPHQQLPDVTITLSVHEWNLIGDALAELPLRRSMDLFTKLRSEVTQQVEKKQQGQGTPKG